MSLGAVYAGVLKWWQRMFTKSEVAKSGSHQERRGDYQP